MGENLQAVRENTIFCNDFLWSGGNMATFKGAVCSRIPGHKVWV